MRLLADENIPVQDVEHLRFRRKSPRPGGVILLRELPEGMGTVGRLLVDLSHRSDISLENHFTVIDRDRIRQRVMPR